MHSQHLCITIIQRLQWPWCPIVPYWVYPGVLLFSYGVSDTNYQPDQKVVDMFFHYLGHFRLLLLKEHLLSPMEQIRPSSHSQDHCLRLVTVDKEITLYWFYLFCWVRVLNIPTIKCYSPFYRHWCICPQLPQSCQRVEPGTAFHQCLQKNETTHFKTLIDM